MQNRHYFTWGHQRKQKLKTRACNKILSYGHWTRMSSDVSTVRPSWLTWGIRRCQNFSTRPWLSFLYFCYFPVFTPLMSFIPCLVFMFLWRNYVNLKSFTELWRRVEGEKRDERISSLTETQFHRCTEKFTCPHARLKVFSIVWILHLLLLISLAQNIRWKGILGIYIRATVGVNDAVCMIINI